MIDTFRLKTKIYLNKESIQVLKELKGTHALIICDKIMEKLGYLQKTIFYLEQAGMTSDVFTDIKPDPDVKVIADGMKAFKESNADVLVAIGGGSAIDAAKGIMYCAWQIDKGLGNEFKKPLFVAIPSTSGTGSEVTDFSVITSGGEKLVLVDEFLAPDIALLDSTCVVHVPQRVVVDTGLDVLVHAVEAYVSKNATDFTDAFAEKAIKIIFKHLPKLYNDVSDPKARDKVMNASCMAGIAFTNAGLGINHSLAHAFGGKYHISHGRSNALLMCPVIEYNAILSGNADNFAAHRYAKLAKLLGLSASTSKEGVINFIQAIQNLQSSLGIESGIRGLNINKNDYESSLSAMAGTVLLDRCTPSNPRSPSKEDIIGIYLKAF